MYLYQFQGKLHDQKKSSIVENIEQMLDVKRKSSSLKSAQDILLPVLPISELSASSNSQKKKNRKKNRKKSAESENNTVSNSPDTQVSLPPLNSRNEPNKLLSKSQRRTLRKKQKKAEANAQTVQSTPQSNSTVSDNLKRKRPDNFVQASPITPPQKKLCKDSAIGLRAQSPTGAKKVHQLSLKVIPPPEVISEAKVNEDTDDDDDGEDEVSEWILRSPLDVAQEEFEDIIAPISVEDFFKWVS